MQEQNQQELERLEQLRKKKLTLYNTINLLFLPLFFLMVEYILPYIYTLTQFPFILLAIGSLLIFYLLFNHFILQPISNRYAADFKPKIVALFVQEYYPAIVYQSQDKFPPSTMMDYDIYRRSPHATEEDVFKFDSTEKYTFRLSTINPPHYRATKSEKDVVLFFEFKEKIFPTIQIVSNESLNDKRELKSFLKIQQSLPPIKNNKKYTVYHSSMEQKKEKEVLLELEQLMKFIKGKWGEKFRLYLDENTLFIGIEKAYDSFSIQLKESLTETEGLSTSIETELAKYIQMVDLSLIALGNITNQTFGEAYKDRLNSNLSGDDLYEHLVDY